MNRGTRIRGILTILACAAMCVAVFVPVCLWIKIGCVIFTAIVMGVDYWYNNDFTPEHCEATGLARIKRKENTGKFFIGEKFFEDEEVDYE